MRNRDRQEAGWEIDHPSDYINSGDLASDFYSVFMAYRLPFCRNGVDGLNGFQAQKKNRLTWWSSGWLLLGSELVTNMD